MEARHMPGKTAVVLIDFLNDLVHPDGKLAKNGYSDYVTKYKVERAVERLLARSRSNGDLIIHVRAGFSGNYVECPEDSPLFAGAKRYGALNLGGWGCEFVDFAAPASGEVIVTKNRVSPFCGTNLDLIMRATRVRAVLLSGCSTDLAVEAAARDAHDRDYLVSVVADACVANSKDEHERSLATIGKIARIVTVDEIEG
jgi:nicotinamidase-related amidase